MLIAATFVSLARGVSAQIRPQVIHGHVTADSSTNPIVGANVVVTVAPTAEVIATKTDSTGAYRISVARATGEYVLNVNLIGWKPFRQRVNIAASDSVAVVNVKLVQIVQTLATTNVNSTHPRPPRGQGGPPGTDGTNKQVDGVTNALSPDLQGNIDAMATLIPGLTPTSTGYSAFGLGADANMRTLNGMQFSGDAVPRDLNTTTRFASSPWDPTQGGFSGAISQTTISPGSNIFARRGRLTLDAPALQSADPIASQFGQRFSNVQLGGSNSGAFSLDKYFYDAGYQASLNRAPVSSLLDFNPDALAHAGISPDSAVKLTQILEAQHIPLTRNGIPDDRTTGSASFLSRFDRLIPTAFNGATPPPQLNIVTGANYSETRGQLLSPTALPATTGKSSRAGALLQSQYSRFFGPFGRYLNETSAGTSYNETRGTPYFELPAGNVLVASSLADSVPTIGSLSFGGNSPFANDTRQLAFDFKNQTTFLINDHPTLPATIFFQSRYERYHQSLSANRLGSFSFASLNDVTNETPSTFTRTLNTPDRDGGEWFGAGAIGTTWNTRTLLVTGGARVDANAFTGVPAFNPDVERIFDVRNDQAPNSIAVSPRVGFNWYYNARPGTNFNISNYSQIIRGGPQIRGGIGEFRNYLRSDLLADPIGTTGLPGSTEQLVCTGPAAPSPNWQLYQTDPTAIPTTCVGGASTFADTAANVTLVDPSYSPSRSWRATLGWTNTVKQVYFAIDGTYSLNLNQASVVDLNFAGSPQFSLANEGGRPVFVPASSIVANTGALSAVDARKSTEFARVSDRMSDLRGDTKQLTLYAIPNLPFSFGLVTFGYTYADARAQARGFDQSAALDPRSIDWAASPFTPKHQFSVQAARGFINGHVFATMFARFSSGLRFTPTVAGDINGDGWSGDRAFIFDPALVADTAVAHGLRDLVETGSKSARDCIASQLNTIAGRNSCVGPWTATMNASVFAQNVPHMSDRMTVTLNLANPLGAVDELLHGSDHLHGWGSSPLLDGTLYQVRGFDPTTKSFIYQVNPRFGDTRPSSSTFRTPFRVTLDVRMDLGPNRDEQSVILAMRVKAPLAGTRAVADTIKSRYLNMGNTNSGYSDVYKLMLHFADSIALSREQTEKVEARQKVMAARADSLYGVLANYLAQLPADYSAKEAAKHVDDANKEMWDLIYAERSYIKNLLEPAQIRLLPGGLREMVLDPTFKGQFYYSF
jgi:hypothetical protein